MRERIDGMARHRGLDLDQVEIHVITANEHRARHPHLRRSICSWSPPTHIRRTWKSSQSLMTRMGAASKSKRSMFSLKANC